MPRFIDDDLRTAAVNGEGDDARPLLAPKRKNWEGHKIMPATPARNLFSELSKVEQERQRKQAAQVKLPWEISGKRPLKPPTGR